ncbi:MAG: EmrB/QacA family drug resistance transporter, partial [Steroidobacteraceae bacterium]
SGRADARMLIAAGFGVQVLALLYMSHLSTDMAFGNAAWARAIQSVGLPFLFVPVTAVAYIGLAPNESNQASAMMNVARNLGGTIGISSTQILLAQRQQFHQTRLVETLNPLNPNYTDYLNSLTHALVGRGQVALQASGEAMGTLYASVERQALMLSFIDVFHALMIVILAAIPLLLLMQPGKHSAAARGGV